MKNRVLVYGMHGYRNLGAESRLMAIVDQLRRMVPRAEVVTNCLHPTALDYLREQATVRSYHPIAYRREGRKLIRSSDCVIFSEGAFIGDQFSPHLVIALTEGLEEAQRSGVASVGLALDSQQLSEKRRERTVRALNGITLLTIRAPGADERLRAYGVRVPMPITADCAVSMPLPDERVRREVRERWGFDGGPVHALAPVDFHMWPAKFRPLGRRDDYARWPYKGTWPDGGRERTRRLVDDWIAHARYLLSTHPRARVMIVVMDRGDLTIARRVHEGLGMPERSFVLDGQTSWPGEISAAYGMSASLTSSRYHAIVLAAAYAIPYVALGHDNRTQFFAEDMGLERCFVPHDVADRRTVLRERHERVMAEAGEVRERLERGFRDMQARDAINYRMLGDVLADAGHRVEREAAAEAAPAG